ncbi:hypothetical protein EBU60_05730 [bacterium]|nr:hypothetical protein [bacterium]
MKFDLDADGKLDRVGWVGAGDGLLARDLDGDGQIDDGSELFGEATVLADGSRAKDGFEALAALDSNRDGQVDAQDEAYATLRIWSDANADGKTDAGELKSLAELGITSISTQAKPVTAFDEGNLIGLTATYERVDGSKGEVADVWFRVSSAQALEQKAADLGDALSSYATGASGSDSTPQAPRAGAGGAERGQPVATLAGKLETAATQGLTGGVAAPSGAKSTGMLGGSGTSS